MNMTLNQRLTVAFFVGGVAGVISMGREMKKLNDKFCTYDERKTAIMNTMYIELQKYAPQEVIDKIDTDAKFFTMTIDDQLNKM